MNTRSADGELSGGGEILKFWGNADIYNKNSPYLDNELINQFNLIPMIKIAIAALMLVMMAMIILRILNIKSIFKGKGITRELDYMDKVRKHDQNIIKANKIMAWVTAFIGQTPFIMNPSSRDYWQYNLNRAGIKIPGNTRIIKADEFHALVTFITGCCIIVEGLVILFMNGTIGWVLVIATIVFSSTLPMMLIRSVVREKDLEIKENFADYYLMMHYVLLANAKTPLSKIMKSYSKTTSSKEMQRYIDSCIHYIDTYGEYEASRYIAREYREIPEVGKLMRLIRQANEGGEIEAELMGFRSELLKERQYAIERRMKKLVAQANASFNLLMPILFQAILSAMSIYISDLGIAGSLLNL